MRDVGRDRGCATSARDTSDFQPCRERGELKRASPGDTLISLNVGDDAPKFECRRLHELVLP